MQDIEKKSALSKFLRKHYGEKKGKAAQKALEGEKCNSVQGLDFIKKTNDPKPHMTDNPCLGNKGY